MMAAGKSSKGFLPEQTEKSGHRSYLWQGLDRLAFCENAILLEISHMSQGNAVTSRRAKPAKCSTGEYNDRFTESFLDDVALLASGPGGKDNVAAACLERSTVGSNSSLVVRIARNEGFGPEMCAALEEIIEHSEPCFSGLLSASGETSDGLDHEVGTEMVLPEQETAEDNIMLQNAVVMCENRLLKHINAFLGEVRHAQYPTSDLCRLFPYSPNVRTAGTKRDIALYDDYCRETHMMYAQILQSRIQSVRRLCSEVADGSERRILKMCQITQVAYYLRAYSGLLREWLKKNFGLKTKPSAESSIIEDIVKRIGKLSRIFRAVLTIAKFKVRLAQTESPLKVMGVESQQLQIFELQDRTTDDLRLRGGRMLFGKGGMILQRMLDRWTRYRTHAEIQLVLFYEKNVDIQLATNYIGGDKLCCYLCHQFITMHNRFEVNGCHQSLYSLWMLPDEVFGFSQDAASRVNAVLRRLCDLLNREVTKLSRKGKISHLYHPQRESCDNLSRLTLYLSKSQLRLPTLLSQVKQASQAKLIASVEEEEETEEVLDLDTQEKDSKCTNSSDEEEPVEVLVAEDEEGPAEVLVAEDEDPEPAERVSDHSVQEEAERIQGQQLSTSQSQSNASELSTAANSRQTLPRPLRKITSHQSKDRKTDGRGRKADRKETHVHRRRRRRQDQHSWHSRARPRYYQTRRYHRATVRKSRTGKELQRAKRHQLLDSLWTCFKELFCLTSR